MTNAKRGKRMQPAQAIRPDIVSSVGVCSYSFGLTEDAERFLCGKVVVCLQPDDPDRQIGDEHQDENEVEPVPELR